MAKRSADLTGIKESTVKEKILKKVRNALISKPENPFKDVDFNSSVYQKIEEDPVYQFVLNLKNAGGEFIYCEDEKAVFENLKTLMKQEGWGDVFAADDKLMRLLTENDVRVESDPAKFSDQVAGITRCDFLVARFGSIIVSSGLASGRRMFVYPEAHIVIAGASQVVSELKDALRGMREKYADKFPSQITAITGPSRTADIEKTLVMGAHGPRKLYLFMIDNQ